MPHLLLTPTRVRFNGERTGQRKEDGSRYDDSMSLMFSVTPARHQTTTLVGEGDETGRWQGRGKILGVWDSNSKSVEGLVTFRIGPIGAGSDPELIGYLEYSPEYKDEIGLGSEPALITAVVAVSEFQFRELLQSARSGLLPVALSLEVPKLTFDADPMGRDKTWDLRGLKWTGIRSVSFSTILIDDKKGDDEDSGENVEPESSMKPTRGDLQIVQKSIVDALAQIEGKIRGLWWVVLAMGILALIIK